MGRVDGKMAIVTGGASGIGRATAELLAREGAGVVVADLNESGAKEVASGITQAGGRAAAVHVDIGNPVSVEQMVASAVRELGALHILFNNAADTSVETLSRDGALVDMEIEVWDHNMAVDLRGTMLCAKYAIAHMIEAGGGSIINTSSNQSLAGDLTQTAYSTAKAGINSLTRYIATQYGAKGIRCNTVSPGAIQTPAAAVGCPPDIQREIQRHNPVGRLGYADDLAYAVLFLASDESTFVTGQLLSVDGGQLAHLPHYAHLVETGRRTTHQE